MIWKKDLRSFEKLRKSADLKLPTANRQLNSGRFAKLFIHTFAQII